MTTQSRWIRSALVLVLAWAALALLRGGEARATDNWFERGLVELKAGRYPQAVEAFGMAIEAVPHDFEALNNRGFARIYTGDYDGAIADCTLAIEYNPGSAKAYNNRGFAHIFNASYEAAHADFGRAIAINPRYVDAYSNRCLAWIRQAQYPRAIADCSQALAINPRSAKSLYNRGFARDRQGDPAGALGDYIQTLTVNPDYIEVFNNIAWILATSPEPRLRDGRRAVAFAEKAAAHAPDINFMDTLAAAYPEAGRFEEAVAMENRVVSILAAKGAARDLGPHVARLSLYEEGRPYRDPVEVLSVSAVTDLNHKLEKLDRLLVSPAIQSAAYAPAAPETETPAAGRQAVSPAGASIRTAQASPPDDRRGIRVPDRTVFTPAGEPVEIVLKAETDDQGATTFDIETVPLQGALRGTLPYLIYTPRTGFTGTDRFTFRAANAAGQSRLATVIINVGRPAEASAASPAAPDVTPQAEPPALPDVQSTSAVVDEPMPTPAVSLPAEPMPGTAAVRPAEGPTVPGADPGEAAAAADESAHPTPHGLPKGVAPESVYSIQVRSLQDAADAAREVARLRRDALAAFSHPVEIPGKGTWHRVFVGGYPDLATARQALADLDSARFKDAYVRRIPAPLRHTAPTTPTTTAVSGIETTPEASEAPVRETPAEAAPAVDSPESAAEPRIAYPYAFQIKSYQDRNDAFQLGVELTSLGRKTLIGVSRLGTTGDWYRVYVGCFSSPEKAERIRDDLAAEGFEDAFLTIIPYTIAIQPPDHDPRGETLENQLLAKGYLPYRLPESDNGGQRTVLVGGFQSQDEARGTLEALQGLGYEARVVLR